MNNEETKYSKNEINGAGLHFAKNWNRKDSMFTEALKKVNYWRSIHKYPLRVVQVRIDRLSKDIDPDATTAYRLKRLSSIHTKLNRRYHGKDATMELTQMQDIAGYRVILKNIDLVNKLSNRIQRNMPKPLFREKNYMEQPKDDGYRCIHLIQKYKATSKKHENLNGAYIEIQLRTRLQHLWATAVETVDFFTKQDIKANNGNGDWTKFFKLLSYEFMFIEGVPTTIFEKDRKQICNEIKKLVAKLKITTKIQQWSYAVQESKDPSKKFTLFLLELNTQDHIIKITKYTSEQMNKAIQDYELAEKNNEKNEKNIVLVRAEKIEELRRAFPNYFADTKEFLSRINEIIKD